MPGIRTPADHDNQLAAAIGRFSQACNSLESQIAFTLTRMLPITVDMGNVLIAGNQMRRNIEIIGALCTLPEVPLGKEDQDKLIGILPRLRAINDDRSRFLHNSMCITDSGYALVVAKNDGKPPSLYPISTQLIDEKTEEARVLWKELYINPIEYDLSKWELRFTRLVHKPYPTASAPKPPSPPHQKRSGRKKSEDDKTNP